MTSDSSFVIRAANAGDLPAILDLDRQTPTAAHWSEEQYRRMFATGEHHTRLAIVAEPPRAPASPGSREDKSPIRGFLVAHAVGPEWELENLVVAPSGRRRGLGKSLIGELIGRARAETAQSIFLEVRESNLAARALYENAGFVLQGRRNSYYANPPEDALIYRRAVT